MMTYEERMAELAAAKRAMRRAERWMIAWGAVFVVATVLRVVS